MIIRTISESMKMIANAMVMRSRFFSTMLVPVWVEYTELAIMSEMPVPLPECSRMNTMRPMPETTSRMSVMMRSGFKGSSLFFPIKGISVRKLLSIAKGSRQGKGGAGRSRSGTRRSGTPAPSPSASSRENATYASRLLPSWRQGLRGR